jgi:hypothetical protein
MCKKRSTIYLGIFNTKITFMQHGARRGYQQRKEIMLNENRTQKKSTKERDKKSVVVIMTDFCER